MKKLGFAVIPIVLTGCANMSGLDASSSFSCKAAPGVTCQSISGVEQNAHAGNLPFQRAPETETPTADAAAKSEPAEAKKVPAYESAEKKGKVSPKDMSAAYSGMPVRQPPLVLRIWMAPYEDDAGDLHDQSYLYTMVHSGKWMIEANRNAISSQFKPVFPLTKPSAQRSDEEESAPAQKQPLVKAQRYENLVKKPEKQ